MRIRPTSTALVLVLSYPASVAAQSPRLLDPLHDEAIYALVERLELRGMPVHEYLTAKPWSTRDLASFLVRAESLALGQNERDRASLKWLRRAAGLHPIGPDPDLEAAPLHHRIFVAPRLRLVTAAGEHDLDPPFASIRDREESGDPTVAGEVGLRLAYEPLSGDFWAAVDARAATDARERYDYRRRRRAAVDVRSGYVGWENDRFLLALGRIPIEWGNGPVGGLGITASGPAVDGFLGRARWGRAQLTVFSAFLPDERANRARDPNGNTIPSSIPEPPILLVDRYFHGHRIDVRVGKRLEFGINEAAIITGFERRPDVRFLAGLVPYYVVQNDRDEIDQLDINLGVGGQYRLRLPGRLLFYGEFFANEVFVDPDIKEVIRGLRGQRLNTQGFQQAVRWEEPFGWRGLGLELEWVRIEAFLYLHRGLNTTWRQRDTPLGSFLGPDNTQVRLLARYDRMIGETWARAKVGLARRERGVGRITSNEDIFGAGGIPQPTPRGTIEERWLGEIEIDGWRPGFGRLGVRLATGSVANVNNMEGEDMVVLDFEVFLEIEPRWDWSF